MRYFPVGLMLTACLIAFFMASGVPVYSHCQVPCGIYTDELRFRILEEHFTTLEKSMNQLDELSGRKEGTENQIARWVSNKETHADEVSHIITWYFMAQRVKPDQENYEEKITALHKMLILSMKCKQTTDTGHVDSLRKLTVRFAGMYLGPEDLDRLSRDHPVYGHPQSRPAMKIRKES
jgi:nickel superoxide dismutase